LYETDIVELGGERRRVWPLLVQVDETGARAVRWETLANLEVSHASCGGLHPARQDDADARAVQVVHERERHYEDALGDWLRAASVELERLPIVLTEDMRDAEARRHRRRLLVGHAAFR
jgi:hypothetical protein